MEGRGFRVRQVHLRGNLVLELKSSKRSYLPIIQLLYRCIILLKDIFKIPQFSKCKMTGTPFKYGDNHCSSWSSVNTYCTHGFFCGCTASCMEDVRFLHFILTTFPLNFKLTSLSFSCKHTEMQQFDVIIYFVIAWYSRIL